MFARVLGISLVVVAAAIAFLVVSRPPPPAVEAPSPHDYGPLYPGGEPFRDEALPQPFEALKPLHRPKGLPEESDWLATQSEPGQTFASWRAMDAVKVTDARTKIYVQPMGTFSDSDAKLVALTCEYISRYFGVPVTTREPLPEEVVPDDARRINPHSGEPQIRSTFVIDYLAKHRPDDALALIALTNVDLYPDPAWNFVFGQASLTDRVGVWSFARFGNPTSSDEAFRLALRRMMTTAVHELGHMLGIQHCVAWECVMNGSNSLKESDTTPVEPCPADLAKLCDATHCDLTRRFDALIDFWERQGHADAELSYLRAARAIVAGADAGSTERHSQ